MFEQNSSNLISENEFSGDDLAYHLRGTSEVMLGHNKLANVREEMHKEDVSIVSKAPASAARFKEPGYPVMGNSRPVGARSHLRGRHNIIMTSWGPWDHQTPLIRLVQDTDDSVQYNLHKIPFWVKKEVSTRDTF